MYQMPIHCEREVVDCTEFVVLMFRETGRFGSCHVAILSGKNLEMEKFLVKINNISKNLGIKLAKSTVSEQLGVWSGVA